MKILLSSYAFYPSVGGIEAVSATLADEFLRSGHELKVITHTPEAGTKIFPYEVVRCPSALKLLRTIGWSDVVLHINISLQTGWPLIVSRKPWVVAHQTWIPPNLLGAVKQHCARAAARNISISRAIAAHIRANSIIIPNPYDQQIFTQDAAVVRDRDLVFVGRLVSDKGVDNALSALCLLKQRQIIASLTIVGGGPEEAALRRQARELGIADQVSFVGVKRGRSLARELGRHKIIVIPSLWNEPFGIVALEGIASGCVAVGSSGGGLKDAIGPCGVTFPNGDVSTLAACLAELLTDETKLSAYRQEAKTHLAGYTSGAVARRYLEVMQEALNAAAIPIPEKLVHSNR